MEPVRVHAYSVRSGVGLGTDTSAYRPSCSVSAINDWSLGPKSAAEARTADHKAVVLKVPICAQHHVRIEGNLGHHLVDRGQLVSWLEQAEQECLANLLNELDVIRDAGLRVQVELD